MTLVGSRYINTPPTLGWVLSPNQETCLMLLRCQGSILEAHADPDVSKADNR
jgi:hypothetical protein